MKKKTAFLFPGQGAQYVGMGRDFYDAFPIYRETLQEADERLGFHLSSLIFDGPSITLTETKNSQVAIYVTSIGILRVIQKEFPNFQPETVAGLSLGEYTALVASKRLEFSEGIDLVRSRGLLMHEASLKHPGTMAVALGLAPEEVAKIVTPIQGVWIANLNCPGQVVISGTHEGVQKASEHLKKGGAKRVLPLDVSGAFHSGLMEDAKKKLKEKLQLISLKKSEIDFVMNVPGDYVKDEEILRFMELQVVSPVLWEKGIKEMEARGHEQYLEIGCGKTLSGMLRKISVQGEILSIEKVVDLEQLDQKGAC